VSPGAGWSIGSARQVPGGSRKNRFTASPPFPTMSLRTTRGRDMKRRHLLRDLPGGRQDKAPGQFGGRVRRGIRVQVRRDGHAVPVARGDVDVREDAALADELQPRQTLDQRRADGGSFAEKHQRLGVGQARREHVVVLHVVVVDGDRVAAEPGEAGQRAQGVKPVVEDRDVHVFQLAPRGAGVRLTGRAPSSRDAVGK